MSTLATSIGVSRVHELASLHVPTYGAWRADAVLDAGDVPPVGDAATLTVGDLVLFGKVTRSGEDNPGRPRAIVVGGAGWDELVARPMSFQSDVGVRLSTVLAELVARAGETIEQPVDVIIGEYYELLAARPGEPVRYRDALDDLARAGHVAPWRVDPDGVTRFGARVGIEVTARATQLRSNAATGITVYGIDSPASFLPGNVVEGTPIARLVVHETSGKLEAEIWRAEPAGAPSLRSLVLRIIGSIFSEVVRTYVVAAVRADKRLDLVPPPEALHLPEMNAVEQWSLGGAKVTPTVGSEVLVVFRDARRTRPVAFAFGPDIPTDVAVDASSEVQLGDAAEPATLAESLYSALDLLLGGPPDGLWTPQPNDGGAALQTAWKAWRTANPSPGPWASSKVRA